MHEPPTHPPVDPSMPAAAIDDAGRLAQDARCKRCGYLLRGLRLDAFCPECALLVADSIRGDQLHYADPSWLRTIVRGMWCYIVGTVLTLLLMFGIMVASGIISAFRGVAVPGMSLLQVVAGLFGFITAIVSVVGAWLVTTPDPAEGSSSNDRLRWLARVGMVMHAISSPTQMYWGILGNAGSVFANTIAAIGLLLSLLAICGWIAYFLYIRRLALRAAVPGVAKQFRIVAWCYGGAALCMSVGGIATALMLPGVMGAGGQVQPTVFYMSVAGTTCCSSAAFYVIEVWAIILHLVLVCCIQRALTSAC